MRVGSVISYLRLLSLVSKSLLARPEGTRRLMLRSPIRITLLFSDAALSSMSSSLSRMVATPFGGLYMFPTKNDCTSH